MAGCLRQPLRLLQPRCRSTAKKFMTDTEWAYWYEGKPAPGPISDPYGVPMEKAGTMRDGGSFVKRVTNIVVLEHADGRSGLHEQALERLQGRLTRARAGFRFGRPASCFGALLEVCFASKIADEANIMAAREGVFGWLYVSPLMLVLVPFFVAPHPGGDRRELPAKRRLRRHHLQPDARRTTSTFSLGIDAQSLCRRLSSSRS